MKILWFCIPAHGHTNPTIEVVRQLCMRGHEVRYYSFAPFKSRIEEAGATFVPADDYLAETSKRQMDRLMKVSTTEMTLQSVEALRRMDPVLREEMRTFCPDGIVSDSVCFWGKLSAMREQVPLVVSTTTFAFNQASSQYMRYSLREMADMMLGLPKITKALKSLEPLGYHVNNALEVVGSGQDEDAIVYTSRRFQPFAETFSPEHYFFAGPSVREVHREKGKSLLLYISLGTVLGDRPAFYRQCIKALSDLPLQVLISAGDRLDISSLGTLPRNFTIQPRVDQMQVLSRANLFLTHCGMNSASEGLYMGVPEMLYPLTGEQRAVARRVSEMGAGRVLSEKEISAPEKLRQVIMGAMEDQSLQAGAKAMAEDFHACPGPAGAADFIERKFSRN